MLFQGGAFNILETPKVDFWPQKTKIKLIFQSEDFVSAVYKWENIKLSQ